MATSMSELPSEIDMNPMGNVAPDDDCSLFGSPPPSPIPDRGRSPHLALPGRGAIAVANHNVGSLALPGSHMSCSELPIHPSALSLSGSSTHELSQSHRRETMLSALPSSQTQWFSHLRRQSRSPPVMSSTHTSCISAPKKGKATKGKSSASRPAPPPIHLPDPDSPPPPNFLRNQQALLGHAGLVGGINPAHLSVKHRLPGSTQTNPIIIEDELNPPPIGIQSHVPIIDPRKLSRPSNEEIISSLVKQRNIFAVLESLTKFVCPESYSRPSWIRYSACHGKTDFDYSRQPDGPKGHSSKRRKLANVPAGAADWDVPYPFPVGEGPSEYIENWQRERGRQLFAQLVTLIKSAMQGAAQRSYSQSLKLEQGKGNIEEQVCGHHKPVTTAYGVGGPLQLPTVSLNHSLSPDPARVAKIRDEEVTDAIITALRGSEIHMKSHQPPTPFDYLVAALLACPSSASHSADCTRRSSSSLLSGFNNTPTAHSTSYELDQVTFESWLDTLQSMPSFASGGGLPAAAPANASHSQSICHNTRPEAGKSATGSSDSSLHSTATDIEMNTSDILADINSNTLQDSLSPTVDINIDPVLLALSGPIPNRIIPSTPSVSSTTASSLEIVTSRAGPLTPSWDRPIIEHKVDQDGPTPVSIFSTRLTQTKTVSSASLQGQSSPLKTVSPTHNFQNAMVASSIGHLYSPDGHPVVSVRTGASATQTGSRTLNKTQIIAEARNRRRQLIAETERAKVECWETSIEGGLLMHLAKDHI